MGKINKRAVRIEIDNSVLAKKMGVTPTYIRQLRNRRRITPDRLAEMQKIIADDTRHVIEEEKSKLKSDR
jgi:DNA-binding transcriptional regulator YdaS (Cro superfamily)